MRFYHAIRRSFDKHVEHLADAPVSTEKIMLLVIGPESSGTRVVTQTLSQHPHILGTPAAQKHMDVLDDVWLALEADDIETAISLFPDLSNYSVILTRRSMPHGAIGVSATYMKFASMHRLKQLCDRLSIRLVLAITTRSFVPHLISWTTARQSAQGSIEKAHTQYKAAYFTLFGFLQDAPDVAFFLVSLESLLLDDDLAIQSIFQLLNLPPYHPGRRGWQLKKSVNTERYAQYTEVIADENLLFHK